MSAHEEADPVELYEEKHGSLEGFKAAMTPQDAEGRDEAVAPRQDSVTDQLWDVVMLAEQAGCYDASDWIQDRLATADPEGEPCERCGGERVVSACCIAPIHRGNGMPVCHLCGVFSNLDGVETRPCPDCCGTPDESEEAPRWPWDNDPNREGVMPSEGDVRQGADEASVGPDVAQPDEEMEGRPICWKPLECNCPACLTERFGPSPSSGEVLDRNEFTALVAAHIVNGAARARFDNHDRTLREKLAEAERRNEQIMAGFREMGVHLGLTPEQNVEEWYAKLSEARAENERLRGLLEEALLFVTHHVISDSRGSLAARIREALEEETLSTSTRRE